MRISTDEYMQLWELYKNDPRPFEEICADFGTNANTVYTRFKELGLEYLKVGRKRQCVICGKLYAAKGGGRSYCSKECYLKSQREKNRKKAQEETPGVHRGRKRISASERDISMIVRKAEAAGVSYGQYVAAAQNVQ